MFDCLELSSNDKHAYVCKVAASSTSSENLANVRAPPIATRARRPPRPPTATTTAEPGCPEAQGEIEGERNATTLTAATTAASAVSLLRRKSRLQKHLQHANLLPRLLPLIRRLPPWCPNCRIWERFNQKHRLGYNQLAKPNPKP